MKEDEVEEQHHKTAVSVEEKKLSINITMPPRLPSLAAYARAAPVLSIPFTSLLLPIFQIRSASILSNLSDTPGAYNKRIRRGRGPSSGKGKTSGRGHKGQKQHGKVPAKFQGGQTADSVVHGVRGFVNMLVFHLNGPLSCLMVLT